MKFMSVLGYLWNSYPLTPRNLQLENLDSWGSCPELGAWTFPPKKLNPWKLVSWVRTHVLALSPYCTPQHQHCTSISMRMRSQETFFRDWASGSFKFQFGAPGKHCEDRTALSANHEHLESLAEWVRIRSRGMMTSFHLQWQGRLIQDWQSPPPARPRF